MKPLVIPKELQRALPFKDKPKIAKQIKDEVMDKRVAIIREPKERKVRRRALCGHLLAFTLPFIQVSINFMELLYATRARALCLHFKLVHFIPAK